MSSRFWSPIVAQLEPYTPGEQPRGTDLLKLNTNESPFPPSPKVLEAIAAVRGEELLKYPDPKATSLREAIARANGLRAEEVFVGNGSDEVLSHVFQGLLNHSRGLLFPDITYSFYPVWCQLHQVSYREVPLDASFGIVAADYARDAAAVILPNPNAPTGRLLSLADLREFLVAAPDRLLVVDEAYIDYGGESAVALIPEYDNLLIVQTLSKSRSLAGLRVGLAMGQASLIEALERVKDSFNSYPLDLLAQRGATAAYEDAEWHQQCCAQVIENREVLSAGLESLGFEVLPSAGNFVFVQHPGVAGEDIFAALRARGIIVRRWNKARIRNYLRISVGAAEDVERVLSACREILDEQGA
jgi:histidinol-phosphate aminotransferase